MSKNQHVKYPGLWSFCSQVTVHSGR